MSTAQQLGGDEAVREVGRYSVANIVAGCALGLLGLAVAFQSLRLGIFVDRNLGPGAWPLATSVVLIVCSVVIVLSKPEAEEAEGTTPYGRLIAAVAVMSSFAVLFQLVGVFSATVVTTLVWLKFIARETWNLSVIVSLCLAAGIYLVFVVLLAIPLPVDAFLPTQW